MPRRTKPPSRATLATVAKAAGVSIKTASVALRYSQGGADTVRKIAAAAERLGYRSPASRGQVAARDSILVMSPLDTNPTYFVELRAQIRRGLSTAGWRCIDERTAGDADAEQSIVRNALSLRPGGAVLIGPTALPNAPALLANAGIPVVVVVTQGAPADFLPAKIGRVIIDSTAAIRDAVKHLWDHGHRRIAYIRGPITSYSDQCRYAAYAAAMRDLTGDDGGSEELLQKYTARTDDAIARFFEGVKMCQGLLGLKPAPTAILAYDDAVAMGCVRYAIKDKGCQVPGDLAVVGHDDLPFAAYTVPALSTIALNRAEIAQAVLSTLLEQIGKGSHACNRTVIARFLDRETTRPVGASDDQTPISNGISLAK